MWKWTVSQFATVGKHMGNVRYIVQCHRMGFMLVGYDGVVAILLLLLVLLVFWVGLSWCSRMDRKIILLFLCLSCQK